MKQLLSSLLNTQRKLLLFNSTSLNKGDFNQFFFNYTSVGSALGLICRLYIILKRHLLYIDLKKQQHWWATNIMLEQKENICWAIVQLKLCGKNEPLFFFLLCQYGDKEACACLLFYKNLKKKNFFLLPSVSAKKPNRKKMFQLLEDWLVLFCWRRGKMVFRTE